MKIAFLGNFDVDYTSETHYLKTFRKMGHEVMPLQEGKTTAAQVLQRAGKADLFFWVHTHGWNTEGIAEVLEILKEDGIPSVGYHLDLWLGIERQKDLDTDPYWNIEHFFTVDKMMADLMNAREDLPKAYYLPAGVYEDECYYGKHNKTLAHDIAFVGSKYYHREWPYRERLINWLEETYGNRFMQYGGGGRGTIRGEDLNDLYASTKVLIGDTLCIDYKYPYYFSDRVFETTGRGGFIIHPFVKGIGDCFELPQLTSIGVDTSRAEIAIYEYGNFDYLKYVIDYYLENEEEREAIRKRGHERTKKDHTYTNRMQFILDELGK